jgi:hypothetical protein
METYQKIEKLENYLWQQCQQLQYTLDAKPLSTEEYKAVQQRLAICEMLHQEVFLRILPY